MQTDLFGEVIRTPSVRKQSDRKATATRLVFDRKALWSTSGYLPGAVQVDKENVAEVMATSDTRSDNATIERLEKALGLEPLVKNGQWLNDTFGFQYRRVGKPFKGAKRYGEKGSLFRDLNKQLVLTSARSAIEPLFHDPCSWLVINSIIVLDVRLRMMDADEDHQYCLKAFLQVLAQHDFIDNTRTGDTIRSLTKRDQMREMRAKQRAAKGLPPIEAVSKPVKVAEPLVVPASVTVEVSCVPAVDDVQEPAQVEDEFVPEPELNADLAEFDDEADEVIASKGGRRKPVSKALMDAFESDDFSYDFD
ncbi:hypothetical protein K5E40_18965 [Pseudomonas baetica]|jgi:hypothetical protein|uniref:hypothetical protein n=1 Tax=Pseudomonas TaxID=286 RepID=UPI001472CB66|nr:MULTISPECIES: hypothetical protein [Pseudomonas]MBF6042926.1 hypothetical protein [Pseudomonas mucoides]MBX9407761.1 hypothetical protein [Pseudomonas baetica]NMX82612.1 hypothetical protein [Pseudomonas sp. WS 5503]NNB23817.1 hypothetical protein [Pseudomonas fragi]WHT75807.1 hypothetical protein QMY54_00542 [Pseudomonas rhodesiae]